MSAELQARLVEYAGALGACHRIIGELEYRLKWKDYDAVQPTPEDKDKHGYVLLWSRSAQVAVVAHADTLTKGARWLPMPKEPT